jgi:hypothetical protein
MSLTRNGFQSQVNTTNPPAVVGDFASLNPRSTVNAGPGALRAAGGTSFFGTKNPIVGNFAFVGASDGLAYGEKPVGSVQLGFVANEGQTVITAFLGQSRLAVEAGFPITLFNRGDFWTIPRAATSGNIAAGDTVYANPEDGSVTDDTTHFSATGVQTGASSTVTISAVTKGKLLIGDVLVGTGVDAGLTVTAQLTGSAGAAGTYTVSTTTGFTSTTVTAANVNTGFTFLTGYAADASFTGVIAANTGILTVSALTGVILTAAADGNGMNLNGVGVPADLFILAQLTGTAGAAGTYQLNYQGAGVSSVAMTASQGKLVKIGRAF